MRLPQDNALFIVPNTRLMHVLSPGLTDRWTFAPLPSCSHFCFISRTVTGRKNPVAGLDERRTGRGNQS